MIIMRMKLVLASMAMVIMIAKKWNEKTYHDASDKIIHNDDNQDSYTGDFINEADNECDVTFNNARYW